MATHKNKSFADDTVELDNNTYQNCKFARCTLNYRGLGQVEIAGCSFEEPRFVFLDAAQRTLGFMNALYNGAGAGGKQLIEATFNNMRRGNSPPTLDGGDIPH